MGYYDYKVRKFKCYRLCSDIQNQLKASILKSTYLIIIPFCPCNPGHNPGLQGFYFLFLCSRHRHKQNDTATGLELYVLAVYDPNFFFIYSQTTSTSTQQPGWAATCLIPPPPFLFKQTTSTSTQQTRWSSRTLCVKFFFIFQTTSTSVPPSRGQAPGSRGPGHCNFFIDSPENPI